MCLLVYVRNICLVLIYATPAYLLQAQEPQLRLDFNRQNDFTYSTILDFNLSIERKGYRLNASLHHDHLINTLRPSAPFVQAYLSANIWQRFRVLDKLALSTWVEYDHFFNSSTYRHSWYLGAEYKLGPYLSLEPLIGYSWDFRSQRMDQGFSPALIVKSAYQWPDGLQMETQAFVRYKFLDPRQQQNLSFLSVWAKSYGQIGQFAVQLKSGRNEIDDYRSQHVERILSDTLRPSFTFRYQLLPRWTWDSQNEFSLSRRFFRYEPLVPGKSEFSDFSFVQETFSARQRISHTYKRFNLSLSYDYEYLNRAYDLANTRELPSSEYARLLVREQLKDFRRNLSRFEAKLDYQIRPRHGLNLSLFNSYIRYDTPAEQNFDDHDELSYGGNGLWRAAWNKKFSTQYALLGGVRRYAFIFGERSQENYTQYSLRMEFNFQWELLKNLSLRGEQYIYSSYNIKDFEDINQTNRSTRNLESGLEVLYRIHKNWDSKWKIYRRETQVSYIDWDRFAETTLDTNYIYILEYLNTIQLKGPWKNTLLQLEAGYKHLTLTRRFNTAMTNIENILVPINLRTRSFQTGPQTALRLVSKGGNSLFAAVWWQIQIQNAQFKQLPAFSILSSNFTEENLRKSIQNFRPYLKLQAQFLLFP